MKHLTASCKSYDREITSTMSGIHISYFKLVVVCYLRKWHVGLKSRRTDGEYEVEAVAQTAVGGQGEIDFREVVDHHLGEWA